MKEKLLGSIVVSHYGPFAKGEADRERLRVLAADPSAICFSGACDFDDCEVLTVLSWHGDDPEIGFDEFLSLASSIIFGVAKAVFLGPEVQ